MNYYYGPTATAGGPLTYFNYPPQPPSLSATGTASSVVLTFSSATSTNYAVWKWNGGSWISIATTTNTTYTDTGLTNGTIYYYTAYAYGAGGWSNASFNGGYVAAVAKAPFLTVVAPTTSAFNIATSTVRLRAIDTDPVIDAWKVVKWNGSSWTTLYNAVPTITATSGTPAWTAFPTAYFDNTNGGNGSFVYVDTGLTQNTAYQYSIAVHDQLNGWSDYTNNNGSFVLLTVPSN